MNQPCMHAWMHSTLCSRARKVFEEQLYKNNARALLLSILSIVNPDWLQHARSVCGVYEFISFSLDYGCVGEN